MRTMLKETEEFKVFLETDKEGIQWKKFRSKNYNYDMNLKTGLFARWGETTNDDPEYSPFGPEILDFEITDICNGIDGKLCKYCYKSNTPNGKNISYEDFVTVIKQVNFNHQLTQVAFGLGATAKENPDLWKMCKYLRDNNIVPNGTVAQLDITTANEIAFNFGGVAVSYHDDFEVLADTIAQLNNWKGAADTTLQQINIHFMIAEETYHDCIRLFHEVKSDKRYEGLNAIVLLGLKQCGRAKSGYTKLTDEHFKNLVEMAMENKIGIGFDSCSANKFIKAATEITEDKIEEMVGPSMQKYRGDNTDILMERIKLKQLLQLVEPCESGLFSSYVNCKGEYHQCSFVEQHPDYANKGRDLLNEYQTSYDFSDFWAHHVDMHAWRKLLWDNKRSCPIYSV